MKILLYTPYIIIPIINMSCSKIFGTCPKDGDEELWYEQGLKENICSECKADCDTVFSDKCRACIEKNCNNIKDCYLCIDGARASSGLISAELVMKNCSSCVKNKKNDNDKRKDKKDDKRNDKKDNDIEPLPVKDDKECNDNCAYLSLLVYPLLIIIVPSILLLLKRYRINRILRVPSERSGEVQTDVGGVNEQIVLPGNGGNDVGT